MTTREGGVSQAPWGSLNLGMLSGDDLQSVQQNRELVAQAMGVPAVYLRQVHSTTGVEIDASTPANTEADAAWTTQKGLACAMMAADCMPILVCHPTVRWVAAAHAGWRGLAGQNGHGVVETLALAAQAQGLKVEDCLVWLGPCIGPSAFEVGEDVRAAFTNTGAYSSSTASQLASYQAMFAPQSGQKYMADLAGLARLRAQAAGFKEIFGNDSGLSWCTYCNTEKYHSHRRDAVAKGGAGRMAAYVWITP
ncbi:MAG: Laccase domain protein YfiH [Pseudomonadota bacterium]